MKEITATQLHDMCRLGGQENYNTLGRFFRRRLSVFSLRGTFLRRKGASKNSVFREKLLKENALSVHLANACFHGHGQIVSLLLDYGHFTEKALIQAAYSAIISGKKDVIALMLEQISGSPVDKIEKTRVKESLNRTFSLATITKSTTAERIDMLLYLKEKGIWDEAIEQELCQMAISMPEEAIGILENIGDSNFSEENYYQAFSLKNVKAMKKIGERCSFEKAEQRFPKYKQLEAVYSKPIYGLSALGGYAPRESWEQVATQWFSDMRSRGIEGQAYLHILSFMLEMRFPPNNLFKDFMRYHAYLNKAQAGEIWKKIKQKQDSAPLNAMQEVFLKEILSHYQQTTFSTTTQYQASSRTSQDPDPPKPTQTKRLIPM